MSHIYIALLNFFVAVIFNLYKVEQFVPVMSSVILIKVILEGTKFF